MDTTPIRLVIFDDFIHDGTGVIVLSEPRNLWKLVKV